MEEITDFETAHPDLYWHIAKGKICAGEPLYGAVIYTMRGTEVGHGESDISAREALSIAAASAGLSFTNNALSTIEAENARLREALENIAEPTDKTTCVGDPWAFYGDLQDVASTALTGSWVSQDGSCAEGLNLDYFNASPIPATAVTDEMVAAGLQHYSEGGCMGLDDDQRADVVRNILEAALSTKGEA